ncbi:MULTISPECIES: ABC transporter substrate-binding protein [Enterococcus]|uniref:Sugar ABC transporter substrate-binding protein n=1 Tax=Enterococcus entomosocium TaxID=3034352 RepID=A0ABV3MHA1_9ENTE|nr:sugar ABC transporter substrate-binding protein [Enterococcus casseliflavus]MBR8697000.1 sugar ABC transporter substrate-binding protein [Enterococcus gallinarum]MCD5162291.1 sugar ABC transporter substrate-binding protein [Enterococcus casseliflavus]MDB1710471.1 sugar ABC transporter substrate-binding protein [Enterococcus casseliflavus]MDB1717873.1 sugar ABC transporter substrate-binding protein [Enterococcus casseliflavus]MDT2962780.1 sugar ABC transporter substrate-binding protein [Ente
MMKKVLLTGVAATAMLLLGACGGGGSSSTNEDQTTIKYYSFSATPDYEDQLNEMVESFEQENEDIKVDVELVPFNDYFTKLQTLMAGDQAPDVFELNYENFVSYAEKDALLELGKYIDEDKDFDSSQLNKEAFEAYQYDGKQYGMVESFSNVVTFYNKDLFDEAGIDYPTKDWSWSDEVDAAKKLTDADNNIYGTYSPVTMNEFYKVAAQNGGKLKDDSGNWTINDPKNVEALEYMVNNVTKDKVSPSPEEMSGQNSEDLFLNGQLAMVHTGIWMFGQFKDADFDWDIQVEAGNTQKATHFFANGLAVSKETKHAEAAYKFTRFMSASKDVAEIRVDSGWELPAVTDDEVLAPYLEQTPPENRKAVFDSLDYLILPPVDAEWSKVSDSSDKEFQKVLLGDESAKDALDNLQSEFGE